MLSQDFLFSRFLVFPPANPSNFSWCNHCFPEWLTWGGGVHETTWRLRSKRKRKPSVQTQEEYLREPECSTWLATERNRIHPIDLCIYFRDEILYLGGYVDDIILAGKTDSALSEVKTALSRKFDIKDLELVVWVISSVSKDYLSQKNNIKLYHLFCRHQAAPRMIYEWTTNGVMSVASLSVLDKEQWTLTSITSQTVLSTSLNLQTNVYYLPLHNVVPLVSCSYRSIVVSC